jgi:hypothetical protein
VKPRLLVMVLALAQAWAAQPGAQHATPDIEVQGSDILRTCREVHRAAQAQEPDAVATPQGITFNCRLINANGSTLAQVSPEEVCERLTGSREWYRGDGTQVYCAADGVKTRAVAVPCPQPLDEAIDGGDVARACAKVHRNANASAESLRITVNGPEFRCRLSNSAGFTIAGVTPEQVCEVKTGRTYWCATETTAYCRGDDYVEPVNPAPGGDELVIPGPKPGPKPKPGGSEEAAEVPPQEEIEFCKPSHPGGDIVVRITGFEKPGNVFMKPLVACGSGAGVPPEKLCPSISGSASWYISANGFSGSELWPNWIAVCRGSGPRERLALADHQAVCLARGWKSSHVGVTMYPKRDPFCHNMTPGSIQPIAVNDICNTLYGTASWKTIGILHWCLP